MSDELDKTVRIVHGSKVGVDDRGRTVWLDPVKDVELELVSTAMLKRVLESDDEMAKQQIRETAEGKDGVLAHDPEKDMFEIIDDDELQELLASVPQGMDAIKTADVATTAKEDPVDADDELSLVSTQMLRQLLDPAVELPSGADNPASDDGGFDPYNSG